MAGGKLSPRQKMINMMYLVLMALLALNVSNEILKAFHLFEVSFNQAKNNLSSKIDLQLASLQKESANQPTLKPYYERAQKAHEITDGFVAYIDEIITELEEATDGRKDPEDGETVKDKYETELKQADNMEKHANYFLVDKTGGAPGWKAKELEDKINNTRLELAKLLKPDTPRVDIRVGAMEEIEKSSGLRAELHEADQKKYGSWAFKYLEHSPLAAVVTLLTKMQSDARAMEGLIIDELSKGQTTEFTIEELIPVVKTKSSAVLVGEDYEAEIFLAARTAGSENNTFELNGGGELEKVDGVGMYRARASSQGTHSFSGVIKVKTKEGDKPYPFTAEYQVFAGNAAISADAMNVLYIGVENPISIAVPGVSPNDVTATISSGSLQKKGGNNYVAKVTQSGKATISVSAKLSNGTSRNMGRTEYKVRRLPKPEARWGAIENNGLPVPKAALLAQNALFASMGEGFAFDGVNYRIVSYQFVFDPRRQGDPFVKKVNGPVIDGQIKGILQRASQGDRVIVDMIRAQGPDGVRNLSPIAIMVQ
ncbi:MAG: gliding motility protein GldM [Flavobacteriales bacterium]|nr:gliding motility protein GldM [Bacteroidota bacterium]MCB9239962.1 gliding motility protein GldM [Flavobacteriales bacterium]